jgi:cytochrome c-type biogenesis protein CcmF
MFRGWTAGLVAATFILCIFGTYLTRSGVVQSVHAYRASNIGTFFLMFLCLTVVATVAVLVARRGTLRPSARIEGWLNRESAFLAGNLLLAAMTFLTLLGTLFPLISGALASRPLSVNAGFYNKAVLPLGLCLVLVMSIGPALDAGKHAAPAIRRLAWPGLTAIAASIIASLLLQRASLWLILVAGICAGAITCYALELAKAWRARMHNLGENPLIAFVRLINSNHRRYGGQIVHMGIALITAGIAGSSLLGTKQDLQLTVGQTIAFAGGSLKFDDIHQVARQNYEAVEAVVIFTDAHGAQTTLRPQRRFYTRNAESSSEVAIETGVSRDLYVTLVGWEAGGTVVSFQAFVNPLVSWIWAGGGIIVLGAIICLLPRLAPARRHKATMGSDEHAQVDRELVPAS